MLKAKCTIILFAGLIAAGCGSDEPDAQLVETADLESMSQALTGLCVGGCEEGRDWPNCETICGNLFFFDHVPGGSGYPWCSTGADYPLCTAPYEEACLCQCPTMCNNKCVDLQHDEHNCGSCGHSCASGQTCRNGTCTCPSGLTLCSGQCVNTATDEHNCGSCGHRCASSQTCKNGSCTDNGGCRPNQTLCNGECVYTQIDHDNCGRCGRRCASYEICDSGRCVTTPP